MKTTLISPSILNVDLSHLDEVCISLQKAGADWIHCDIMDGVFVSNKSFDAKTVATLRKAVAIPLDVHLMVQNPKDEVQGYLEAGADIITFHFESSDNIEETARFIRCGGAKVGLSVKPATPVEVLAAYKDLFDMILIMTVEPGFGGQKFLETSLDKIRAARKLFPQKLIEVDGGINDITGKSARLAGADILVSGSYIINSENMEAAIRRLKFND